jgi:tetratricopeptide (TPR) repeat protein
MASAGELIQAEEYQKALELYENAVSKAETANQRIQANIEAGNLSAKYLRDLSKAEAYFQATIADVGEYSSNDLYDLAQQALEAQANQAAVNMYHHWMDKFSDHQDLITIKYELAEVYHKNVRDLRKAIATYNEIYNEYPDTEQGPKALFSVGYIYANELAEDAPAVEFYSLFLEKYPDHEMAPSVEFELKYIGKSLEEIPELQHLLQKTS